MDGFHQNPVWRDVLAEADLASTGRRVVKVDGLQIAVFLVGEEIVACNNRCPHEGYPLVEGDMSKDCVLTCNWHNWKFDLSSGETLVGGDRLRRYPTRTKEGRIEIDVSEPSPEQVIEYAVADLIDCFDDHEYDRMARELARIQKAGGDPIAALRAIVHHVHDRFEFGMGHAIAAGADWMHVYQSASDDPVRRLALVAEIIGHLAWDTRRHPRYPYPAEKREFEGDAFVSAVEREDEQTAISMIRGALDAGLTFKDVYFPLCQAALAHYQDFGHSLIYVVKAREFVDAVGDDVLEPVLLMLVRSLIYATREDLIPEFKAYAPALEDDTGAGGTLDLDSLKRSGVARVLKEIAAAGDPPLEAYHKLVEAAAWQMLHMDLTYSLKTEGPVQENVGWLDFTHALTFANAVRLVCTEYPELWPQGLLQIGCFLGRNSSYISESTENDQWTVADPLEFVSSVRDNAVDHSEFEYIVIAHVIKTSAALADEITAAPDSAWKGTAAAALNRFANSPLRRKNPLKTAFQASEMVRREG